jgi:hypothetical protein
LILAEGGDEDQLVGVTGKNAGDWSAKLFEIALYRRDDYRYIFLGVCRVLRFRYRSVQAVTDNINDQTYISIRPCFLVNKLEREIQDG